MPENDLILPDDFITRKTISEVEPSRETIPAKDVVLEKVREPFTESELSEQRMEAEMVASRPIPSGRGGRRRAIIPARVDVMSSDETIIKPAPVVESPRMVGSTLVSQVRRVGLFAEVSADGVSRPIFVREDDEFVPTQFELSAESQKILGEDRSVVRGVVSSGFIGVTADESVSAVESLSRLAEKFETEQIKSEFRGAGVKAAAFGTGAFLLGVSKPFVHAVTDPLGFVSGVVRTFTHPVETFEFLKTGLASGSPVFAGEIVGGLAFGKVAGKGVKKVSAVVEPKIDLKGTISATQRVIKGDVFAEVTTFASEFKIGILKKKSVKVVGTTVVKGQAIDDVILVRGLSAQQISGLLKDTLSKSELGGQINIPEGRFALLSETKVKGVRGTKPLVEAGRFETIVSEQGLNIQKGVSAEFGVSKVKSVETIGKLKSPRLKPIEHIERLKKAGDLDFEILDLTSEEAFGQFAPFRKTPKIEIDANIKFSSKPFSLFQRTLKHEITHFRQLIKGKTDFSEFEARLSEFNPFERKFPLVKEVVKSKKVVERKVVKPSGVSVFGVEEILRFSSDDLLFQRFKSASGKIVGDVSDLFESVVFKQARGILDEDSVSSKQSTVKLQSALIDAPLVSQAVSQSLSKSVLKQAIKLDESVSVSKLKKSSPAVISLKTDITGVVSQPPFVEPPVQSSKANILLNKMIRKELGVDVVAPLTTGLIADVSRVSSKRVSAVMDLNVLERRLSRFKPLSLKQVPIVALRSRVDFNTLVDVLSQTSLVSQLKKTSVVTDPFSLSVSKSFLKLSPFISFAPSINFPIVEVPIRKKKGFGFDPVPSFKDDLVFTPDFTARALGLSIDLESQSQKDLQKLLRRQFSGLEIARLGIKI